MWGILLGVASLIYYSLVYIIYLIRRIKLALYRNYLADKLIFLNSHIANA
jgi:hypothetical protein